MFVGHVSYGVEDPVHLRAPASVMSVIHLFGEILQGLLLALLCEDRQAHRQVEKLIQDYFQTGLL